MPAVDPHLVVRGRTLAVDAPAVMGIVNASPESFSGDGSLAVHQQARVALDQLEAGALMVDLGGQSANTRTPELAAAEECARLVPLVEAIRASGSDGIVSIDTYKPEVADACLAAGADVINDVSGLLHPELADVVASHGAGYVLMHTHGRPKTKVLEPALYDDVVAAVVDFLAERLGALEAAGVPPERVLIDPGLDFGKTPRQTLDVVARIEEVAAVGRPLLLAVSRKDFIGAIAEASPRRRDPGTLATVASVATRVPETVFRVHDVAATVQLLRVLAHIADPDLLDPGAVLAEHLRRESGTS